MPVFTYKCQSCGKEFDKYWKNTNNNSRTSCEECGGLAEKAMAKLSYRWRFNDK